MIPTPISPHVSARRSNLYLDRKNDPDFAAAWADAMTACMTVRADVADDFLYQIGSRGWAGPGSTRTGLSSMSRNTTSRRCSTG